MNLLDRASNLGMRVFGPKFIEYKTVARAVVRSRVFELVSLSKFRDQKLVKKFMRISSGREYEIPGPTFIGDYFYDLENYKPSRLVAPPCEIFEFEDVEVMGGTNLVFSNGMAVHPDLTVPKRDMFSVEISGEASVIDDGKRLQVVHHGPTLQVDEAISLLGECTGNYAHWLLETLPKLVAIDEVEAYKSLPILVDSWIHPMFFQTISLMNTNCREIIRTDKWNLVNVGKLVCITPPSYTAPEDRKYKQFGIRPEPSPAAYPMDPRQLEAMREKAVKLAKDYAYGRPGLLPPNVFRVDHRKDVELAIHTPPQHFDADISYSAGRRIYFKRTQRSSGNPRQLLLLHRVESLLAEYGFIAIDPAILLFPEQVLLVQNAECVVAPLGAALANTIFAPPGVNVIGLSPYFHGADFHYFSNMMGALGHKMHYVLGPQVDQPGVHWLHRDYYVNLRALKEALDQLCPI